MGTYTVDSNEMTDHDVAIMEGMIDRWYQQQEKEEPEQARAWDSPMNTPEVDVTSHNLLISHRQMASLTGRTPAQIDHNIKTHINFEERMFSRCAHNPALWVVKPEAESILPANVISLLKNGDTLDQPILLSTRSLGMLLKPAVACGAMRKFKAQCASHHSGATVLSFHNKEKKKTYNMFMIAPWEKSNTNAWSAIGHVYSTKTKKQLMSAHSSAG